MMTPTEMRDWAKEEVLAGVESRDGKWVPSKVDDGPVLILERQVTPAGGYSVWRACKNFAEARRAVRDAQLTLGASGSSYFLMVDDGD
jgi:hypothetical protein